MTEHRRDSFTAFLVAKGRKDGIVSLDSDYGLGTHDVIEACADLTAKQADACLRAAKKILRTDPRDAEIARLKAEVEDLIKMVFADGERAGIEPGDLSPSEVLTAMVDALAAHKRALAAGPTRLRALRSDDYSPGYVAGLVEAAQEAAMKEKP